VEEIMRSHADPAPELLLLRRHSHKRRRSSAGRRACGEEEEEEDHSHSPSNPNPNHGTSAAADDDAADMSEALAAVAAEPVLQMVPSSFLMQPAIAMDRSSSADARTAAMAAPPAMKQAAFRAPPMSIVVPADDDDGGDDDPQLGSLPISKRWEKPEVLALIKLHGDLVHSRSNGRLTSSSSSSSSAGIARPKAHGLWEEISSAMAKLGYPLRSAKRCKEKWENINKYFKKKALRRDEAMMMMMQPPHLPPSSTKKMNLMMMNQMMVKKKKKRNAARPHDARTCVYFHELEALYKKGRIWQLGDAKPAANSSRDSQPVQRLQDDDDNKDGNNNNNNNNVDDGTTADGAPGEEEEEDDEEEDDDGDDDGIRDTAAAHSVGNEGAAAAADVGVELQEGDPMNGDGADSKDR
jgi:hypothetical protein